MPVIDPLLILSEQLLTANKPPNFFESFDMLSIYSELLIKIYLSRDTILFKELFKLL